MREVGDALGGARGAAGIEHVGDVVVVARQRRRLRLHPVHQAGMRDDLDAALSQEPVFRHIAVDDHVPQRVGQIIARFLQL